MLDPPVAVENRQELIVLSGVVEDQRAVAGSETHLLDVQHAGIGGAGLTTEVKRALRSRQTGNRHQRRRAVAGRDAHGGAVGHGGQPLTGVADI